VPALSISLVTFNPNTAGLTKVVACLLTALQRSAAQGEVDDAQLYLVDNGPGLTCSTKLQDLLNTHWDSARFPARLISGHGNVGYGQGHNKALEQARADYHLILNPDVLIADDALSQALEFMEQHPEVGLLAPAIMGNDGGPQHLCKNYPAVLDLALRGFAPRPLKSLARKRLSRYELKDLNSGRVQHNVPLVSGSFMFFRRRVLDLTGGFSKAYFLYFEDFDLSIRAAQFAAVSYVPAVRVQHEGGFASKKGPRHWWMFCRSAFTFFSQHGWRWY
jgi:GT2 family glycosyltransferase